MKNLLTFTLMILSSVFALAQSADQLYSYEPSDEYPFGQVNPDAPKQTADFAGLIGTCACKSISRIDRNTWADTTSMLWTWKYIMNGWGVQDETLKADGKHSGSIRQFIADSSRWFVHYYSSNGPTSTLPTWEGNKKENGDIILFKDQTAPNGTAGWFRLTFSNISDKGYNWIGEWTSKDESFVYPTWKIFCKRE